MSEQHITVSDLETVLNIIDVASKRGAFQGNELKQVGDVYSKIQSFVTYAKTASDAAAAGEQPSTVETEKE